MNNKLTSSDKELLECIKKGDQLAFAELYRKYWYSLFLVAYRRLNYKQLAEELVQELFVNIWTKREVLQVDNVEHYLLRAIKFAVINQVHTQQVQDRYAEYQQASASQESFYTEEVIAYHDLASAIENGLRTLPEKSRQVFQLNRLENWPVAKIANHLHLSEKAIGYHLTKSLKMMRVYLKEFILCVFLFVF
jgi:RNA polymerase sigma-70 factor (family 1)